MSLLNVESYVFINVFYLVLFCIHVCVDDVIKKTKQRNYCLHLQEQGENKMIMLDAEYNFRL